MRIYAATCGLEPASMKVSVILAEPEAQVFQAYCDKNGYKKSTLICRLIREHLENENFALQTELRLDSKSDGKREKP
jgi:hypothetical protein